MFPDPSPFADGYRPARDNALIDNGHMGIVVSMAVIGDKNAISCQHLFLKMHSVDASDMVEVADDTASVDGHFGWLIRDGKRLQPALLVNHHLRANGDVRCVFLTVKGG